jgi:multimeric flavodoxin WrbA
MKVLLLDGSPKKDGATSLITEIIAEQLSKIHIVESICLGDKRINYCIGCKACHIDGICCQDDNVESIVHSIFQSDVMLTVVPSYWADVPGQMKVFIDRCTPYSNTNPNRVEVIHKPKGYVIALRTGSNPTECEEIIKSINHFYGHMEIEEKGSAYFCRINDRSDIEKQRDSITLLCDEWFQ